MCRPNHHQSIPNSCWCSYRHWGTSAASTTAAWADCTGINNAYQDLPHIWWYGHTPKKPWKMWAEPPEPVLRYPQREVQCITQSTWEMPTTCGATMVDPSHHTHQWISWRCSQGTWCYQTSNHMHLHWWKQHQQPCGSSCGSTITPSWWYLDETDPVHG